VVTTPEVASLNDVRKELNFCQKTQVPILGLIENMGTLETTVDQLQFKNKQSGDDCSVQVMALLKEKCPELLHDYTVHTSAFAGSIAGGGDYDDGTEQMALDYQCPFWGRLPLDPNLLQAADEGECFAARYPSATAAKRFQDFCQNLLRACPLPSDDTGDAATES
jgi:Mrp family chromosome partitioning ATPase